MNICYSRLVLALVLVVSPVLAADDDGREDNAWYWYNKAVDLANEGKFSEALTANERALSINQTMPIAWANQAGILVQLQRYDEAIAAADKVISVNSTGMPNTYAAAYYSKGDALRAQRQTAEAREAYAKAYALDNTLVPPDLSRDTPLSMPRSPPATLPLTTNPAQATNFPSSPAPMYPATTPRSSLPAVAGITAVIMGTILCIRARKSSG